MNETNEHGELANSASVEVQNVPESNSPTSPQPPPANLGESVTVSGLRFAANGMMYCATKGATTRAAALGIAMKAASPDDEVVVRVNVRDILVTGSNIERRQFAARRQNDSRALDSARAMATIVLADALRIVESTPLVGMGTDACTLRRMVRREQHLRGVREFEKIHHRLSWELRAEVRANDEIRACLGCGQVELAKHGQWTVSPVNPRIYDYALGQVIRMTEQAA